MPGREDFAIIRARLLSDPRAHQAATLYIERGIALEATALAAVVGHVAMLGLFASRETDDGVLPGDATIVLRMSAGCPSDVARTSADILRTVGMTRPADTDHGPGTYLCGFSDCYQPIVEKRRADAQRKLQARLTASTGRPKDIRGTSTGRPRDVRAYRTGPDRKDPPPPPKGGEIAPSAPEQPAQQPRPRDRQRLARILDYVVRCGRLPEQASAIEIRSRLRNGLLQNPDVASALDSFRWVTPAKLARLDHENGHRPT